MNPRKKEHGTRSTYVNYKCRCRPCRDAWAAYSRKLRKDYKDRGICIHCRQPLPKRL